jgi:hypothetical protein
MKTESSLPYSQQPATCPYPETDQSSPCPIPLLEGSVSYYPPIYFWSSKWSLSLWSPQRTLQTPVIPISFVLKSAINFSRREPGSILGAVRVRFVEKLAVGQVVLRNLVFPCSPIFWLNCDLTMRKEAATWNTLSHPEDGGATFRRNVAAKSYPRQPKSQFTIIAAIPAMETVKRYSNSVLVHVPSA